MQGRLIEVLSDKDLATFLDERLSGPLDMHETGFTLPPENKDRFTQMHSKTLDKKRIEPFPANPSEGHCDNESRWHPGGRGLVSTTCEYLRFCQMLLHGGKLDGNRIPSRKTIELMTTNHVEGIGRASAELFLGCGLGLDFAVHIEQGQKRPERLAGRIQLGRPCRSDFLDSPDRGDDRTVHDPDAAAPLECRPEPIQ